MTNLLHILLYLFMGFTLWLFLEAQAYRVRTVKIKNKKVPEIFNGFKIVFISDIHFGKLFRDKRLISIVNRINKLEPDIIIIGGDYLDVSVKSNKDLSKYLDKEIEILRKLRAKQGIFTVLGNHDYYKKRESLLDAINSSSFKLLKNTKAFINIGEDTIELIGLDDLIQGKPDVDIVKQSTKNFTIAISHNPDFFGDYKNLINYDLALSGHTHGGQVTFFGLYAPYTSSKYGQRYVKKIVHEESRKVILTNGIGNGMLPIRFFAIPEIVEIKLCGTRCHRKKVK